MQIDKILLMRALLFLGGMLFFLTLELLIPYRPVTASKIHRWSTNISLAIINSIILNLAFADAALTTAARAASRQAGILNMIELPQWLKVLATVIFMDFMLYVWHFLNHKMPLLWRFHRVHHTDLNMDVSTAARFHIGELSISAIIKISLILFLGADVVGVVIFESILAFATQFHHSSLKVPRWFENLFWILFVPPSMHRIHHSVVINERDTNYGTIFSLWDRTMGTLLNNVDQKNIRIGVGIYQNPDKLKWHHLLIMPFTRFAK